MNNKKLIAAIENFDKIKHEIISDATIVSSENGAVIYARVADLDNKYAIGQLIVGDTPAVLYGLSRAIILLAEKSDYSISTLIETIENIIDSLESEV